MRVVLDTNVIASGLFFSGPSSRIQDEVFSGRVTVVLTAEIIAEYARAVCSDPDDKFFACAVPGKARLIVSGDRHLIDVSGALGVEVLTPRAFMDSYLQD